MQTSRGLLPHADDAAPSSWSMTASAVVADVELTLDIRRRAHLCLYDQ